MAKNKSSAGKKAQATAYKMQDRAAKNKMRKLAKHLKKHPNDIQGKEAHTKGVGYNRKNPIAKNGWVSEEVRNFVKNYTLAFHKFTLTYKELSTMGRENSMQTARAIKLIKKAANSPKVFTKKGLLHPFYVNKFNS